MKAIKRPKTLNKCITLYTTIHHSMLCYCFKHTTDFIGQNTRGRSPHASLDINTTSNYCPVSLSCEAQLVERQTPDSEVPRSNLTNTQLKKIFCFEFICWKYIQYNPKEQFKKKKRKKAIFFLSIWVTHIETFVNNPRYRDWGPTTNQNINPSFQSLPSPNRHERNDLSCSHRYILIRLRFPSDTR